MTANKTYIAEVDLGEAGILVLEFKRRLNASQRSNVQRVMEHMANTRGPTTIVLEDGCKYSVIQRNA